MSTATPNPPSPPAHTPLPTPQAPTTEAEAPHVTLSLPPLPTTTSPTDSDPEKQTPGTTQPKPDDHDDHKRSSFLARFFDALLQPFNMFAPLPEYDVEKRLKRHPDERIHHGLYKILVAAQVLRTQQWRIAYWMVTVSLICTLGTALFGIASSVLSFNNHPAATRGLSIVLAGFGIVLSLLKGTGQPINAFTNYNRSNDIIDAIEDFSFTSDTIDTARLDQIKSAWRAVRDTSVQQEASIWKNIQK